MRTRIENITVSLVCIAILVVIFTDPYGYAFLAKYALLIGAVGLLMTLTATISFYLGHRAGFVKGLGEGYQNCLTQGIQSKRAGL